MALFASFVKSVGKSFDYLLLFGSPFSVYFNRMDLERTYSVSNRKASAQVILFLLQKMSDLSMFVFIHKILNEMKNPLKMHYFSILAYFLSYPFVLSLSVLSY